MRTRAIVLSCLFLLSGLGSSAQADLLVTELFHVDPGWEAGGYWEFTVTNTTTDPVYMIAIGNVGADFIAVRYPDLDGVWHPTRVWAFEWDSNEWPRHPTDGTLPDTSTIPFASAFPGATQVLIYYVRASYPPLGVGNVLTGLYFNYPVPDTAGASAMASTGSPFLAFNGAGEVVASGQTTGAPLSTTTTTWGAVKALYR